MELIDNLSTFNHLRSINDLLTKSQKIILCSGWLKYNGLQVISRNLELALQNGANIIVISNHTDKRSINYLKKLKIKHILTNEKTEKYFHTKLFYFEGNGKYTFIIGSTNLTFGALTSNDELSVLVNGTINDLNHKKIFPYLNHLHLNYVSEF